MSSSNKDGSKVLDKLAIVTGKPVTLEGWLKKMKPELSKALPKHIQPDRILRICMTAIRVTPKLRDCDPMSFLAAVMQSAQLGLEPNTPLGEAYLIPYAKKVQFQMGYRGLLQLANNTGKYRMIYAHAVYKNDKFSYALGLHKDLVHVEADEPEGEPVFYYAVYHLLNGGYDFSVWSRKKVEMHKAKYSKSGDFQGSSWQSAFDSMAKKTVLKDVLNYAPKSIELARQLSMDDTIKTDIAKDMSEVPDEAINDNNGKVIINKVTGEVNESEVASSAEDKLIEARFISK